VNVNLARRLGNRTQQRKLMHQIVNEFGYLALTVIAVLTSAVATDYSEQLLTVAVIFGWKWICGNQTQVIQIYTNDHNEPSSV